MKCVECQGSGQVKQQSGYREMNEPVVGEKPKVSMRERFEKWIANLIVWFFENGSWLTILVVGFFIGAVIFLVIMADNNGEERRSHQTWMFVDRFNGTQKCFLSHDERDFVVSSQGVKVFLSDIRNPEIPASLGVADLNQCVRLSK